MNQISTFLDTSACVDILFKGRHDLLTKVREAGVVETSHYSRMEIKKGYINDLIYLHNLLVDLGDFSKVFDRVRKLNTPYHRRMFSSIMEQYSLLYKSEFLERPIDKYKLTREFQRIIHGKIMSFRNGLQKIVNLLTNEMDCYRDLEPPKYDGGHFVNKNKYCYNSGAKCRIFEFFKKHRSEFSEILIMLGDLTDSDMDDETRKRRSALHDLLKDITYNRNFDNSHEKDAKLCWACSDAIIAVTSLRNSKFLTSNGKHFIPIFNALKNPDNLSIYKPE